MYANHLSLLFQSYQLEKIFLVRLRLPFDLYVAQTLLNGLPRIVMYCLKSSPTHINVPL